MSEADLLILIGCIAAIFLATRREFWFFFGWTGVACCFVAGVSSLLSLQLWAVVGFYLLAFLFAGIAASAEEKSDLGRKRGL